MSLSIELALSALRKVSLLLKLFSSHTTSKVMNKQCDFAESESKSGTLNRNAMKVSIFLCGERVHNKSHVKSRRTQS